MTFSPFEVLSIAVATAAMCFWFTARMNTQKTEIGPNMSITALSALIADVSKLVADAKPLVADIKSIITDMNTLLPALFPASPPPTPKA